MSHESDHRLLPTSSWHQNDPDMAMNHLLAAFHAGELMNRLCWCLEQVSLFPTARQRRVLAKVWQSLARQALAAVPDTRSGSNLQKLILDQRVSWEETINSEAFADDWHEVLQE